MEAERTAMTSSMRDVKHGVSNFTRCTVRPSGPVKSGAQKTPARSRHLESVPALPPVGAGGCTTHVRPAPVFMQVPQPGRPLSPARLSPVLPALSAAELPRLVAEVGPEVAVGDCLWADGPQLMASVLGVHIPSSADTTQQPCEESTVTSVTKEDMPKEQEKPAAILNTVRGSKLRLEPLTGMEVADVLMRKTPLGKRQLVHLEVVEGEAYRPYDLRVVPHDWAGPEHYVFSPSSVLHVRDGGSVGFQTLREWRREALLWNRLQGLSFFRNFRLHRVLSRWRRNVRRNLLWRTRDVLQERLLFAVPQFREALLQVSRLIEELKEVHWLPQDASQACTLQEFHTALLRRNKEARPLLEKFLQYRSLILNMVHEDSFRAQRVLQQRLEQTRLIEPGQPLHLQQAQQRRLRQDLAQSESALRRLGNMAALVSHMTVQSLATVAQREVSEFLRNAVKRTGPEQEALFLTELVFRADGQLSLVPDVHLLHDALRGALCSVTASVLQVIDTYLRESEEEVLASPSLADAPQDLTPDLKLPRNNRESGSTSELCDRESATGGAKDPSGSYSDVINLVPRPLSPGDLVLPNASVPRVEGQRLRGHYCPPSRPSLEWQLSASVCEQAALRELDTVIQEVVLEVERLCERCSWLGEVRRSCSQWSAARLEAMRGRPALRYEELIERVKGWGERLRALPAYFTTANRLITVRCSRIRDDLAPQVASMEQEVLMFLQEEVQRGSEVLVSQLRTAADWLRDEPADLESFSQYASRVKQCERQCSDWRGQMQYLQSLREALYLYSRPMNPSQALLQAQVRDGWSLFLPLLERAGETVKRNAPSMADVLDRTASSLIQRLQDLVSQATSGPHTDPSQDSSVMETQLRSMCSRFCTVAAQLERMRESSIIITNREKPLDTSSVAEWKQKLEDRRELWELLRVSASYIHEWKQLPFRKFVVLHAQEKVDRWQKQAVSLERTVPPSDMVLKHVRQLLEGFGQQLPLLAELSSPTLKRNHWGNILKGTGLGCTPDQDVTVADLLRTDMLKNQDTINKVCLEAKAAADTEQTFRSVQQRWEGTVFRLANFLLTMWPDAEPQQEPASRRETPGSREGERHLQARQSRDSGTFIVIGLEALQSQAQETITTLYSSLLSPNPAELRPELEFWVRQLQELEELLDLWKQFQLKWSYLSKMFQETGAMIQKPELYQRFLPVDETYREMILTLLKDPRVLNFVQLGHGHPGLHGLLVEGLSTMEGISAELLALLQGPRDEFPRLCFLSDGEVMELLSLHPTPSSLLPLVRRCFPGVQTLEIAYRAKGSPEEAEGLPSAQPWVSGVFGSLGERVPFPCPVEPSLDSLAWLTQLEQRLRSSMVQLMMDCAIARQRCQGQEGEHDLPQKQFQSQEGDSKVRDTLPLDSQQPVVVSTSPVQDETKSSGKVDKPLSLWDLISSFPLQCLLVVEEALWCQEVRLAFTRPGPAKRSLLKSHYNVKLQSLCQLIQDTCVGRWERSVGSRRVAAALRAMILLAIKHSQQLSELIDLKGELESSFEWQRLMKYHLSVDDCGPCSSTKGPGAQDMKEVSCYVDILNSRLSYGYEYLSPECWTTARTVSSDQAILGTLLALICYRGGFIAGPRMSGKTETLAHLGQALGRTVITMRCYAETSAGVILRMLMGALQTGAWLLLDCADSMPQGVLSLLGQHLSDIHRCFSSLLSHRQPQPGQSETRQELKIMPTDKGGIEPGLQVTLGGKTVTAKLGYGCILFSSSRRVAEIPENLRGATRPVYLVQPDYGVIAEATLAASGFSEAASMSHRLVSLLNLAKDSACLPKSICSGQSSWLVLLHRVLTLAGIYLNRSMRVEWEKDRMADGDHEARRQLLNMVLRAPEGLGDRPKSTCRAVFRRANQCVVVMQTIAEEQAIIKAVTSAVASSIIEPGKARHFVTIFGEIFPGARCPPYRLQGREEMQEAALKAAVVEELHGAGLQPNSGVLSTALALFQAMRLSRAVVLLGLSGSGKTVCYRALVGALKRLASREAKEDGTEALSPSLTWSSVDVSVIFPNAMSIDELWGGFYGPLGCWQDGVITKALRESQALSCTASPNTGSSVPQSAQQSRRQAERERSTRWLVLDGEPLGCASWLDPLYTLCDPKDPLLCLPTGEKLQPPHEALKVLIEATDLSDASPAALARCGLVHHSAEDLWRAVWRTQLLALNKDPTLEQSCLTVWSRLADDLFPRTLTFLRERRLASLLPEHDASGREGTHGVQEVMSFSRVLCSLKEQFGRSKLKSVDKHTDKSEGPTDGPQTGVVDLAAPLTQQELQARNVFVVAYIWGFGGHLHPRHWPQFDEFARSALYESRYRIVVPAEASVFECLFHLNDGPAVETHSQVQNRSLQASCNAVPQYERHLFLLRLMAKARQPALVVGEVGLGKTTLCYSAIGAKLPHLRLPVGAPLTPAHLRALLTGVACPSVRSGAMTTVARQARLLLFLDDLHDAPCDVFGKASMALETLRQCMSTGTVVTASGRRFRLCSSGVLSFIASAALPCNGTSSCRVISPRLSRLFSILALPSLSQDLLFSIHSPRLQLWISELPLVADMASCILTATLDLYHAVRQAFPPRFDQPLLLFSPHDLRKVFQGMCLWRPPWDGDPRYWALHKSTSSPSLSVVRLWAHECMRTFGYRLDLGEDRGELVSLLTQVSHRNFTERLASELKVANKGRETHTPSQSTNSEPKTGEEEEASTGEESSGSSTEEEEDEERTESEEVDHSTSCVSVSLSERVELSDVLSEEPDLESVNYSAAADGDNGRITSQDTLSEASRTTPALPSPPKDSRPQSKLERASSNGSGKLVIRLPRCTSADQAVSAGQSPVSTSVVMEMLGNLTGYLQDVVFFLDVSRSPPLRARPLSCKRSAAYKEQELEELLKQLATVMKLEKEEARQEKGQYVTSYGVHRQGVRQLASALRALLLPGGHGLLFGSEKGTGRKTTVRLAAQLLGYQLLEVHSGNEAALWVMLKEASASVGLRREGLVLLVHGNVSQVVRDELLVAMANRNFPRLYSYKEWKIDKPTKGSKGHDDHRMTERYFRQVPWNVHLFLLMPLAPGVQGPKTEGCISRALSLCSCVEVYQLWDKQALAEVATHYLRRNLQPPHLLTGGDGTCLVPSLSNAMSWIYQSARRYTSVLTPDLQPFSTQNYFEFLSHFLYLCAHLYNEGRSQANRLAAILGRMKEMTDRADQYYREFCSLSSELSAAQQWQAQVQCDADSCRSACERARRHCLLEETRLAQLEEQLQQARQLSHDALQQVSPLYQAALEAMRSLSQSDLDELRRYRRPPEGVMGVLDVMCVLFGRSCTWESCQQLLGSPNFLQELEFYDRSMLCWEMFGVLSEAVRRPGFQPEAVREVSRACESLCRWVRAVHQYACAVRRMAPHEARRAQLEAQAAETRTRLRDARLQEEEARVRLEQAERRLQEARSATEELAARLRLAETRKRDAAAAVQQVAPHMASWRALAEETERGIGTIPGDALILAAALAYLGRFGPDVRSELLGKWRDLCVTGRMETDPADPRTAHLPAPPSPPPLDPPHVPVPLGECLQAPIARLLGGVRGVSPGVPPPLLLKLFLWGYRSPSAQHCPLLANMEQRNGTVASLLPGQLTVGVSQAQAENEFDLVVSADDPSLLDKLKEGAERGLTSLVTHVERSRPTPEFLGLLGRPAQSPTLNRPIFSPPAAPAGFHLFLSTPLPIRALRHEIHPSILAEVQVVDFSLSGAELQEVTLAVMMQSKRPQIWSQNCQARTEKQMLLEKLHQQEVSLMEYVLQTSTPLLRDPHFLPRVSACQTSVSSLQEEVQELERDMEHHSPLLARFRVEAGPVADFYQALQEVARLSPLYLFPVRCYLSALREGLALQETADLTFGADEGMGEVSAEVLVAHLMAHFRPRLFQTHANVLRLLVSVAVSRRGEGCSEAERVAFLRGLGDEDFPGLIQSVAVPPTPPSQLPDWLPAIAQREVLRLESLPSFRCLTASLTSDSEQWAEYLRYPSSTVIGPVPCPSHSHLSILQRALLWKTLLPHWLAAMADDFAACQLGKPFQTPLASNPHPGTPEALSETVERAKGPIVLILPEPSEAAPAAVHPLSLLQQTALDLTEDNRVKTVQVVTFGAECQRDMVMKALDRAVQEGHWLVFNNCHLLNQWDDEVVYRLTQLVSGTNEGYLTNSEAGGCGKILGHPDFRLWFITRANAPLSIPAAVRSFALRLACDSPWDLREVLRCSLRQLSSASVAAKPVRRCVALHAVLLQRRAYGHLGQTRMYCWTQEDLQALLDAQVRISSHCNDPVGTLEYIAGALVYGGHVEDPADLETVKGVARACLRPPPSLWGRGPHTLAERIAGSRFGQRPLQQAVEGCIQTCAPSTDPLLLGLSSGLEGELVRMRSHALHLLLRDSQTPGASPPAAAPPPLMQAQDRLQALRDTLGRGGSSRATPQTPLGLFLQQEWDSLVKAVTSMRATLTEPDENCAPCPTLCTLSRLEARAQLLGAYLWKESPETPPYAYRLSAFANPRGFLAALLREGARGEQGDVSRLSLHFQVQSAGTVPSSLPSHGAYLCGLELQGALWDTRLNALQDTLSPKPCPLPPVWVTAQSRPRKMPPGGASASLPLYRCPLYLDGEFGDGGIIIRIPLAAKLDPVLCALRPVRLVSTL